jgi:hypothetical protein
MLIFVALCCATPSDHYVGRHHERAAHQQEGPASLHSSHGLWKASQHQTMALALSLTDRPFRLQWSVANDRLGHGASSLQGLA